jgi:AcrR family transcriptional regulator
MPRTEESNQRIREEQTHKIVQAATRVFAHKGLAATKMADIASEAGIGYGLLYHYFASKELIFKATVERGTQAFERLLSYVSEESGSPWERIHQLTTIILDGIRREPESYLVSQQAFVSDTVPQDIREMAREQSRRGMALFQQLVVEGQRLGQIAEGNPAELTEIYFACIGGIAQDFIYLSIPEEIYPRPETLLRLLKP